MILDGEFVQFKGTENDKKFHAACMAAVDLQGNTLFGNTYIRAIPSAENERFQINFRTIEVNGITADMLYNAKVTPDELKSWIMDHLRSEPGNYVVTHGQSDLPACGITSEELKKLDNPWINTQLLFQERVWICNGLTTRGCGLKKLVKLYYDVDIQTDAHSPLEDAVWTARLLREQFVENKTGYLRVADGIEPLLQAQEAAKTKQLAEQNFFHLCLNIISSLFGEVSRLAPIISARKALKLRSSNTVKRP